MYLECNIMVWQTLAIALLLCGHQFILQLLTINMIPRPSSLSKGPIDVGIFGVSHFYN